MGRPYMAKCPRRAAFRSRSSRATSAPTRSSTDRGWRSCRAMIRICRTLASSMIFFTAADLGLQSASIEGTTSFGSSATTPAPSSSKTIVSSFVFENTGLPISTFPAQSAFDDHPQGISPIVRVDIALGTLTRSGPVHRTRGNRIRLPSAARWSGGAADQNADETARVASRRVIRINRPRIPPPLGPGGCRCHPRRDPS